MTTLPLILAAVAASGLINLLIQIIVGGLILYLLWWLIGFVGLPDPFAKIARAVLALVAVIFLINLLLGLTGNSFITF